LRLGRKDGSVSGRFHRLDKAYLTLLIVLGAIGLCVFAVFSFVPFSQLNESTALVSFIGVTFLLIAGYMLGFLAVGFVAVLIVGDFGKLKK
jgi:hypothetical protein